MDLASTATFSLRFEQPSVFGKNGGGLEALTPQHSNPAFRFILHNFQGDEASVEYCYQWSYYLLPWLPLALE